MIPELGHFALILALVLAAAQTVFGLVGAARGNARWQAAVRPAVAGQFVLISTAIGALSRIDGPTLHLTGEILSPDGRIAIDGSHSGPVAQPAAIGHELGQILRDKAGSDFFKLFPA